MSLLKDSIATARWRRAQNKVDRAVSTLSRYGLGYSRTDGVVGDPGPVSRREERRIKAAADTMGRFQAGFYRDKQTFTKTTEVKSAQYAPLKFANYSLTQDRAFQQASSSMHLRASLKFSQRTNFDPRFQFHPNRRSLGLSPEEAQEWAAGAESIWRDEKELKSWDESEKNDYSQLSDMALWSYKSMGEFFAIRRAYFDDDERINNISLQIVSPYQVQTPGFSTYHNIYFCNSGDLTVRVNAATYLADLPDGHYIEAGIEYDGKGREVAIFLAPADSYSDWQRIPIKNEAGFIQVLHGFVQTDPGQKRGIPESAHSWHEFMNIRDLCLFELESARLNTVIAGSVTADSNAQPGGQQGGVKDIGQDAGWNVDGPSTSSLAEYQDPGYSVRQVEGGGFIVQNFTPGYKYTELDTKRPNINIPEYIDRLLNFIYPSIGGLARTVVSQKFGGSYNASKGEIDLSWKNGIEYDLKQFSSDWHRPNYKAWLAGKVATGEIACPGWEDMRKREAWSSMSVITPQKPSLNPLQEARAGQIRADELFSNRELEAQSMTGTSAEENAERLAQENQKLAEARKPLQEEPVNVEQ